jgi:hypothetical protein
MLALWDSCATKVQGGKFMAEDRFNDRLQAINDRLAELQTRTGVSAAEEYVRLYQERRELLRRLGLNSEPSSR